jgi:ABC-type sugar transport system ATPase subunit
MGAGRTELAKAVYGLDDCGKGTVSVEGKKVTSPTPWNFSGLGVGFVPEDRKSEGVFGYLSLERNVSIAAEKEYAKFGHIDRKSEHEEVEKAVRNLDVKASSLQQLVEKLSGGNQQKVIIARWLVKKNLKVLILDEPTRGIDVGAKSEIYAILNRLANEGLAIIVMSSEIIELLSMCDRIYVMHEGKITAELNHNEASQELIMQYAIK